MKLGYRRELLGRLASDGRPAIQLGMHSDGLLIAARHDYLDGLGLLEVARVVLEREWHSSARGLGNARAASGARALVRRAWEVALRPPAVVAPSVSTHRPGDSFARTSVDQSVRTAELIFAGARALTAWNLEKGASSRRIAIAIGASKVSGETGQLADRSAFLRLVCVERLSTEEIRNQLAHCPEQPNSVPAAASAATGTLLRLAAPRLGSTLLISHLGEITDGSASLVAADAPELYPVSGGGSGLSLGAVTVAGRTTLTVRSRAAQHDDHHLQRLLALVVDSLD
jgi:hypothetical protein